MGERQWKGREIDEIHDLIPDKALGSRFSTERVSLQCSRKKTSSTDKTRNWRHRDLLAQP